MRNTKEKTKLSIRIPRDMLAKIRVIAEKNNRSLNEEIAFLIDEDCKKYAKIVKEPLS